MSSCAGGKSEEGGSRWAHSGSKKPIAVIIGSTGVGKTKLGVDLAKAFNGEVINADAMQMYKGLSIATAKVTEEEAQGVPHHLMSFLEPWDQFTVQDFKPKAMAAIADIHSRDKLPIVVGGTMYYIQSIIRPAGATMDDPSLAARLVARDASKAAPALADEDAATVRDRESDTESLWRILDKVDNVMSRRLHPNDRRKIQRALEVYDQHHVKYSDLLVEQALQMKESAAEAECPFSTRVFWLKADREVLHARLDSRVDGMVAAGLIDEVQGLQEQLHKFVAEDGKLDSASSAPAASASFTTGVLQAIGYKEFTAYIDLKKEAEAAGGDEPPAVGEALDHALELLKRVTRRYATKQGTFARNRLQKRGVPLIELDSTDVSQWSTLVLPPAHKHVEDMLAGVEQPVGVAATGAETANDAEAVHAWQKFWCEDCKRFLNGEHEWERHLASRKHRRGVQVSRKRKRAQMQASGAGKDDSKDVS